MTSQSTKDRRRKYKAGMARLRKSKKWGGGESGGSPWKGRKYY